MADPFENFILPLRAVFSDPKTSLSVETGGDTTQFYATVAVAISDFSGEAMREAADRLIKAPRDQYEGRAFPPIDRCVQSCREAESDIAARKKVANAPKPVSPARGADDWKFAHSQLGTPLAGRAAKEGWAAIFIEFCRVHGRQPLESEIAKARAKRREMVAGLKMGGQDESGLSRIAKTVLNALRRREENSRNKILEASK